MFSGRRSVSRTSVCVAVILSVVFGMVGNAIMPARAHAESVEELVMDALDGIGLGDKARTVKTMLESIISGDGELPFAADLVHALQSGELFSGAEGAAGQLVQIIDLIQALASTGNIAITALKAIPADLKVEFDLPLGGGVEAALWAMKQDVAGHSDAIAACGMVRIGDLQAVFGVTDGDPLGDVSAEHLANPQHQAWAFFDVTRDRRSYVHGRLPVGSGALPYFEAVDYVDVGGNTVRVKVGSMTDTSVSVSFGVGIKGSFDYTVSADVEVTGSLSVEVSPVEAASVIRGATLAMTNKLKTLVSEPRSGGLSILPVEDAAGVLKSVLTYLSSYAASKPDALGAASIGADVEAGIGIGIWDTAWPLGSASGGVSLSAPLASMMNVSVQAITGLLDFGMSTALGFQQLTSSALAGQIDSEEALEVAEDIAQTFKDSAANVINSVVTVVDQTMLDLSFSIDVGGESDSDQGGGGDDGAGDTINLLSGSASIPAGAVVAQALDPGFVVDTFKGLVSIVATFAEGRLPNALPDEWTGLASLAERVVDGTSFGIQFITPVGGAQVSLGIGAGPLLQVAIAHGQNLVTFIEALIDCAEQGSLEPIQTQDIGQMLAGVLEPLREAEIGLSLEVGANGDIGAEALVTVGAGASVSAGMNAEMILMALGSDSEGVEGAASVGLDVCLNLEGGVNVGEFAELALTGGAGLSTNLFSAEITEWDGDRPLLYEVRTSSNANLKEVVGRVLTASGPGELEAPVLDYSNAEYDVWVPYDTTGVDLDFRPSMAGASVWHYLHDEGYEQERLYGPLVLDMTGKDTMLVRIGVLAPDGLTVKEYRFNLRRRPSTKLAGLAVGAGTLTPAFSPDVTDYVVDIPNSTTTQAFVPVLADPGHATLTVNGVSWASNAKYSFFPVVGNNLITMTITAAPGAQGGGVEPSTYRLNVRRAGSSNNLLQGISLSAGSLSPSFDPNTASYGVAVAAGVSSLGITAVAQDATATVAIGGLPAGASMADGAVSLAPGTNTIPIRVTAQDGSVRQYTLTVERDSAQLQSLTVTVDGNQVQLAPAFNSAVQVYRVDIPQQGSSQVRVAVNATPKNPGAGVTVNGQANGYEFTVDRTSHSVFQVDVTRPDIGASMSYVVVVNGVSEDIVTASTLQSLSLNVEGQEPLDLGGFDPYVHDYYVASRTGVTEVLVEAVPDDLHALVLVNGRPAWTYDESLPLRGEKTLVPQALQDGATSIDIVVYPGNGGVSRTYHVSVTTELPLAVDARATNIWVKRVSIPQFDPDTYYYNVDVGARDLCVDIMLFLKNPESSVWITDPSGLNGLDHSEMGGGTAPLYGGYRLQPGPNTVYLDVDPEQPGVLGRRYTLVINRALSPDASLAAWIDTQDNKGLMVRVGGSPVPLTPAYNTDITSYTLDVAEGVTSVGVRAIPWADLDPNLKDPRFLAGLTINGIGAKSGEWREVPLNVGPNVIDVTVTAPDGVHTKTYTVTVNRAGPPDTAPPVIGVPVDMVVEATSAAGAQVTFNIVAQDAVDGRVNATSNPPSGSIFPIGVTTVQCSARDAAGNQATKSFNVRVVDTTPPGILIPLLRPAEAVGPAGAPVNFSATVTDSVDPDPEVTWTRQPGSVCPLGVTPVTVTATDDAGNIAFETFEVRVVDTRAPSWVAGSALTATDVTQTAATLTWPAATDEQSSGVTQYRVYRDGGRIATVSATVYGVYEHKVTGLTPGATYTFEVEAVDAGGNPTPEMLSCMVTTTGLPVLGGSVSIVGAAKYGEVLTADTSGLSYTPDTGEDVPAYQWKRDGVNIDGATGTTYTLTADDIGKRITVTVSADGVHATGSVTSDATAVVEKADGPSAPAAPELESKTHSSVTLKANSAYEFRVNGGEWQDSNVFTGLQPSTRYTFTARVKETATHKASVESAGLEVTTEEAPSVVYLAVYGTDPEDGEMGVPVGADIVITFNKPVWRGVHFEDISIAAGASVVGYVYVIDGATLTLDPIESLDYSTEYTVTIPAGAVEDGDGNPLENGCEFSFETVGAPWLPVLGGSVSIVGAAKYGEVLTADTSGLSYTPDTGEDVPAYRWKRDGVNIDGATGTTYTLTADDIGKRITVTVSADGAHATGSVTSKATAVVEKADGPAAPAAPELKGKTHNSVTLKANSAHEFRVDGGEWQDSDVFTGLQPSTRYTFTARVKETATHKASVESAGLEVTTEEAPSVARLDVYSTEPRNGETGVSRDADIVITFNMPVWRSVYFEDISIAAGASVVGYVHDIVDATLTLDPIESLDYSTEYTVTIPAGAVEDGDGNPLKDGYEFSFETRDRPSRPSEPRPPETPKADVVGGESKTAVEVRVETTDGKTTVTLDENTLDAAFEGAQPGSDGAKTVTVEMPEVPGTDSYELEVPADVLAAGDPSRRLEMVSEVGTISLPGNMLEGQLGEDAGDVAISMGAADTSTLPEDVQEMIGDRPVVQLSMTVDGERHEWNNPDAPVTVSIPYTPSPEELEDPEHITVWYIDGAGNVHAVTSGRYDPVTGTVTFTVTHFSEYAVVYVQKTFSDLADVAWAKDQVEVLASKGILRGVTETEYRPAAAITRADYLYFLVRTLGVSARFEGNFDDVPGDAYYFEEIGVARRLGITNGVGGNRFDPAAGITRQDMMTLTARALRMFNRLRHQGSAADVERFSDYTSVAPYAVESVASLVKEGLIQGDGERLNPLSGTTRAEAAVFLYRIYNSR